MWLLGARAFLGSLFGGVQGILIVALIAGVAGAFTGYRYRDARCDAAALTIRLAEQNALTKAQTGELTLLRRVIDDDAKQAAIDALTIDELERNRRDLFNEIAAKPCFSASDVERLRDYFRRK